MPNAEAGMVGGDGPGGEIIPDCLRRALEDHDAQRKRLMTLIPAIRVAEEILARHRISEDDNVSILINIAVSVDITMHVNHWRDVVPILRDLAECGYRQRTEPGSYFDENMRCWYCGRIMVFAYLASGETALCRKVQVGTEEVPIYKWECDNGAE